MKTSREIEARIENIETYYHAGWATKELAAPSISELIWVLTGEEAAGEAYLGRGYWPDPEEDRKSADRSFEGMSYVEVATLMHRASAELADRNQKARDEILDVTMTIDGEEFVFADDVLFDLKCLEGKEKQ